MYKLELTEKEHEFLKFCMETILSTDWYASTECMEMAEALQEKLLALPKLIPEGILFAKLINIL